MNYLQELFISLFQIKGTVHCTPRKNIVLRDNSSAVLWDNSRAELWGNSSAELWCDSSAVLHYNSSAVLWNNSRAELWDNSSAVLWNNSKASLQSDSRADLWDNSSAVLRDNSSAVLRDFSVAHNLNNCMVTAGKYATVVVPEYPGNIEDWCAMKLIDINDGKIKLYKAVKDDYTDFRSGEVCYEVGSEVVYPLWNPDYEYECGCALHLADSLEHALSFVNNKTISRCLEVEVDIKDCRVYGGKPNFPHIIRARACRVLKEIKNPYVKGN